MFYLRKYRLLLPTLSILSVISSCSVIPAKLVRSHALGRPNCPFEQESLHALLEIALKTPNEGDSAHALGHAVEKWRIQFGKSNRGVVPPAGDSSSSTPFRIRFRSLGNSIFSPGYFDELSPAIDYRVKKIDHHRKDGIGSPLRAIRENNGREPGERHFPPEAITREVTAVLYPGKKRSGVQNVEIELRCALHYEDVIVNGHQRELAADYSVALAALLERSRNLKRSEVADLFTPSPARNPKLYLMEPYDSRKEPLIMIHGLLDSPLAWATLTNSLRSVPDLRSRYQIWHYLYNTSAPPLYSGRILRNQYREIRKELDPGLDDPASQRTTLLTHSMGGIVARSLITEPGSAFWDVGFTKPIDSLRLSPEDRASLQDAFFWKSESSVRRVIFIATPHRGSEFADNPVGRLGRALVRPPTEFREFYQRITEANPGAFTDVYAELGEGKLDSVGALSPMQPTLQILPDLPLGHEVVLHSIIGNQGKDGPLEESSDGVVPYWSSHLPEAASEKVVPSSHSALENEDAIEEVKRILRLR